MIDGRYGALMWSMGKVVNTPEVVRVYVGSFWDQIKKDSENYPLLIAEQTDLLADLRDMPRNAAIRKVNEIVKRARLAKVLSLNGNLILGPRAECESFKVGNADRFRKVIETGQPHSKSRHGVPQSSKAAPYCRRRFPGH